jgi:hypothetical protein
MLSKIIEFDQIQHVTKAFKKLRIKENCLNLINNIYRNTEANIKLNGKKLDILPTIENKTRIFAFTTTIYYLNGSPT